jgi:hypothetical protein
MALWSVLVVAMGLAYQIPACQRHGTHGQLFYAGAIFLSHSLDNPKRLDIFDPALMESGALIQSRVDGQECRSGFSHSIARCILILLGCYCWHVAIHD